MLIELTSIKPQPAATAGYAMLEYLVALALVATGILGVLQVQTLHTRLEQNLLNRVQAYLLLADLRRKLDIVRLNTTVFSSDSNTPPTASVDCRSTQCSESDLAAFYLAHWKCRLGRWAKTQRCHHQFAQAATLPQGDGGISTNGDSFNLTLRWQVPGQPQQTLIHRYVPLAQ